MNLKERAEIITELLYKEYPNGDCTLNYSKDYELLFAVRLAAQCTDARVNMVTPAFFSAFPTLEDIAAQPYEVVEEYIHSCGFYKAKARDIVNSAKMLLNEFNGKVPGTMDELLKLPGVGRKTANLILGDIYKVPSSIVVDTHCIRISGRLGLTQNKEPEKIERDLRPLLPPEKSNGFCHRIVLHGRAVCTARNPQCGSCCLSDYCPSSVK